ncbi:hypothetical protein Nmel_004254 [Mimus melanotis]
MRSSKVCITRHTGCKTRTFTHLGTAKNHRPRDVCIYQPDECTEQSSKVEIIYITNYHGINMGVELSRLDTCILYRLVTDVHKKCD